MIKKIKRRQNQSIFVCVQSKKNIFYFNNENISRINQSFTDNLWKPDVREMFRVA